MAKFMKADMWVLEHGLAKQAEKTLVLAAVNMTRVDYKGKQLKSPRGCGSMSAGTSFQMATQHPEVEAWWARVVFYENPKGGVHVAPKVQTAKSQNVDYGVFVVKDWWWQEAPQDAKRILWHIKNSVKELMEIAGKYDHVVLPMVGTGFGRLEESDVIPFLELLPDNVIVVSKPPSMDYGRDFSKYRKA